MSQTSDPKRDVISIATEVDGEVVIRRLYAVRESQLKHRRYGDGYDVARKRAAKLKRFQRALRRSTDNPVSIAQLILRED